MPLADYRIVRQIGAGSFGKCFLATYIRDGDGRQYILKQLNLRSLPDKERRAAREEAHLLISLAHPFIVKGKESFVDGTTPFFQSPSACPH
jgi:serine/threonine protein kinase